MDAVTLHTARLELSAPHAHDVDAIFAACQDAAIQRYTTVPSPYAREDAESFVPLTATWWAEEREATWAIRAEGRLVGVISLRRVGVRAAEIGYWMSAAARGRGYLVEAAAAVLEWGLSPAGWALERIEWRAVVGNEPSARAARALGFRYEGLLRGALINSLGRADAWVAGLLPGDDRTPQRWDVLEA